MVVLHVRLVGRCRTIQIQWFDCAAEVEKENGEEKLLRWRGIAAKAWTRKMRERRNRGSPTAAAQDSPTTPREPRTYSTYRREHLAHSGGWELCHQTIPHAVHGIAIIRRESHSTELQLLSLLIIELPLAFALSVRVKLGEALSVSRD